MAFYNLRTLRSTTVFLFLSDIHILHLLYIMTISEDINTEYKGYSFSFLRRKVTMHRDEYNLRLAFIQISTILTKVNKN